MNIMRGLFSQFDTPHPKGERVRVGGGKWMDSGAPPCVLEQGGDHHLSTGEESGPAKRSPPKEKACASESLLTRAHPRKEDS